MVNVVLEAKNQALKLCAVDGVDMVSLAHGNTGTSEESHICIMTVQKHIMQDQNNAETM